MSVPPGHVTALVGPNGAGKTTLLKLLVGLCAPSSGEAEVLGRDPEQSEEFLASIGYLAQDVPLYKRLSADDHLKIGTHLNLQWDLDGARERLAALKIPMNRPVATLSGGQQAQVGLSLVLAKQPRLLLLDEPMAALDPLARREFLESLTAAVADGGLSVVVSSHLLHDLERVCDHLILLSASRNATLRHDRRVARWTSQPGRSAPGPARDRTRPRGHQGNPDNQADAPSRTGEWSGPRSVLGGGRSGIRRHCSRLHGTR